MVEIVMIMNKQQKIIPDNKQPILSLVRCFVSVSKIHNFHMETRGNWKLTSLYFQLNLD